MGIIFDVTVWDPVCQQSCCKKPKGFFCNLFSSIFFTDRWSRQRLLVVQYLVDESMDAWIGLCTRYSNVDNRLGFLCRCWLWRAIKNWCTSTVVPGIVIWNPMSPRTSSTRTAINFLCYVLWTCRVPLGTISVVVETSTSSLLYY